jgi:hypothetical protein
MTAGLPDYDVCNDVRFAIEQRSVAPTLFVTLNSMFAPDRLGPVIHGANDGTTTPICA